MENGKQCPLHLMTRFVFGGKFSKKTFSFMLCQQCCRKNSEQCCLPPARVVFCEKWRNLYVTESEE